LASVSADDVRDLINVNSAEVLDAKVLKMIKRAEVTLELETRCLIHPNDWFSSSITSWVLSFEPYLLMGSARLRSQKDKAETMVLYCHRRIPTVNPHKTSKVKTE